MAFYFNSPYAFNDIKKWNKEKLHRKNKMRRNDPNEFVGKLNIKSKP